MGRTLDAIESGDMSPMKREIDWVIKQALLDGYTRKHGVDLDHPGVAHIALSYTNVMAGKSVFRLLEDKGLIVRITNDASVARAAHVPPHTRAELRSAVIVQAERMGGHYAGSWGSFEVQTPTGAHPVVGVPDPAAACNPRVEAFVRSLR